MKSAAATLAFETLSVLCLLQASVVSGSNERDRLFRNITQSYLKSVEPDDIVLNVGIAIICAREDKTTGGLATIAWVQLIWSDERLAWNPKDYGGIESIRLPSHLLWLPDMKLFNSITPVDELDHTNAFVFPNGTIVWVPTVLYRTFCSSDSDGNGLDCQFNVGSWTYDVDTVKLGLTGPGVILEDYQNSTCPMVADSASAVIRTKYYPCCKEPYSYVEINLKLKRR